MDVACGSNWRVALKVQKMPAEDYLVCINVGRPILLWAGPFSGLAPRPGKWRKWGEPQHTLVALFVGCGCDENRRFKILLP